MIDAHILGSSSHLSDPPSTAAPRPQRWTPGGCVWCGSIDDVALYRDEPRCATCREHETVIDSARKFIGMYGLRPLGAAVTSDDDEEHAHRVAARNSRTALDGTKLARRPAAVEVRSRTRPKTPTPRAAPTNTRTRTSVNVQELGERVAVLMEKLSSVDAEITALDGVSGLPARARLSDLERQRTTTLTTLAALEKARRNHTPG